MDQRWSLYAAPAGGRDAAEVAHEVAAHLEDAESHLVKAKAILAGLTGQ